MNLADPATQARPTNSVERQLIDLPLQINNRSRLILLLMIPIFLIVLILGSFLLNPLIGIAAAIILLGGTLVTLIIGIVVTWHAGREVARRMIRENPDTDAGRVLQTTIRKVWVSQALGVARQVAQICVQCGFDGQTVRLYRGDKPAPIQPITVPFEAQELDQTSHRFQDLQTTSGQSNAVPLSGIRRNILLKGGWLLVIVFGFNLAIQIFDSWMRWRISPMLVYWTIFFVLMLAIPAGVHPWSNRQLLAVPGGLVFRSSSGFHKNYQVIVFNARLSVLCVFPVTRRSWGIVVASKEDTASVVATQAEAEFALQAWLSPLDPPDPEELTDFI